MAFSIGKKLTINTLLLSATALIVFMVLGFTAVLTAKDSFINDKLEQLTSIREIKKNQIENFYNERQADMAVLTETVAAFAPDAADNFQGLADTHNEFFINYQKAYGYYDLFLISPDGQCFYSVAKEADYQSNLLTGPFKDSNLGELVRKVLDSRQYALADFAPYAPSNNEPAAFIAQPLIKDGQVQMIIALQVSLKAINNIMQERTGMGKTGETYLIGSDKLMRSDSFLDPTNHSVVASFANPDKGAVDTEASREALAGKSDEKIITDYNGNPVLSAYTPVKVGETTWALIAEIDEHEVRNESVAATNLMKRVFTIGIIASLVMVSIITFNAMVIRNMAVILNRTIKGLGESAEQVSASATQISASSLSLAEGASEQAAALEETSSALEEMSAMTKHNAENSFHADNLMKEANSIAGNAAESMRKLTTAMDEISSASAQTQKIIKTIDEIAFQTNLLALNAAVEAARAGEAGAGFAVVADEVRSLAMRAAEAAKDTAGLIEGTVSKIQEGTELVKETDAAFASLKESNAKAGGLISEITNASEEQANGVGQINLAVTEMDKVTQQNAANSEENASASEQLGAQSIFLRDLVNDLVALVTGEAKKSTDQPGHTPTPQIHQKPALTAHPKVHAPAVGAAKPKNVAAAAAAPKTQPMGKPEDIIPMDNDDFEDF
ncbi:MAG: methyl-accepting chemotaxis protein [Desulfobulbaceae bacterium]|nr:methyl-accepting chemotaxis protein [Desulfobulbaceae bacterium]